MNKNEQYWQKRQARQRVKNADLTHNKIRRRTEKMYNDTLLRVEKELSDLYDQITDANHVPSANELYRYNRYYKTFEYVSNELAKLHSKFFRTIDPDFEKLYRDTVENTIYAIEQDYFDSKAAKQVSDNLWKTSRKNWSKDVWCSDGLNAEIRHKKQMYKLQQALETGLVDCVARGKSKDQLITEIEKRFGVERYEADRLVRTELTYLQNQATMDSYVEEGVKEYQFLATLDNRTSEHCLEENGKHYPITDARVGDNYPPCHPNCRCTTIPYLNRSVNRQLELQGEFGRSEEFKPWAEEQALKKKIIEDRAKVKTKKKP